MKPNSSKIKETLLLWSTKNDGIYVFFLQVDKNRHSASRSVILYHTILNYVVSLMLLEFVTAILIWEEVICDSILWFYDCGVCERIKNQGTMFSLYSEDNAHKCTKVQWEQHLWNTNWDLIIGDGQSRSSINRKPIYLFVGTCTFSDYSVVHVDYIDEINLHSSWQSLHF